MISRRGAFQFIATLIGAYQQTAQSSATLWNPKPVEELSIDFGAVKLIRVRRDSGDAVIVTVDELMAALKNQKYP